MAEEKLKKRQSEYIVITVLVLVALFIGINRFKQKKGEDEIFTKKEFNERWKEVEILEAKVPHEEEKIDYNPGESRIPFQSPFERKAKKREIVEEEITLPQMAFQGMVWNSIRPQAIINNKVYDINDTIIFSQGMDKVKIIDIRKEGIYLRYKGRDFLVKPK